MESMAAWQMCRNLSALTIYSDKQTQRRNELRPRLPPGYRMEHDSDLLVLRRQDGSMVGAFSARGATKQEVEKAAYEDYRESTGPRAPHEGEDA